MNIMLRLFKLMQRSLFIIWAFFMALTAFGQASETSIADGNWSDDSIWDTGQSPGFTGLTNPVIDSYAIAHSGLTFAATNGNTLTIKDTLIVYGDVTFDVNKNNAGITIERNNVLIIFGNLEMGKNNAGVDIAEGGVLVVKGNITSSGNNGEITGDGNYYTDGTTGGMSNNSSNPEGTSETLSDDGYTSIEEFVESDGSVPLPVELLYFRLEKDKNEVLLKWATATEIENDYFSLERSSDGENFDEIGKVDGNGTSKRLNKYTFRDKNPKASVAYYRLKQVDFDGQYEYYDVRRIDMKNRESKSDLIIFPSTVSNGTLNVRFDQPLEIKELYVYSFAGNQSRHLSEVSQEGVYHVQVNVGALPDGMYILKIIGEDGYSYARRFNVGVE